MRQFKVGIEYERQVLLDFLGSRQAQSGVLWGDKETGCVICTSGGCHGKKAGYSDEPLAHGDWWYFGQGTSGDQKLSNPANAKLASKRPSVVLFSSREPTAREVAMRASYGNLFSYRGRYNVVHHEVFTPSAGVRAGEKLLRFRLVIADGADERAEDSELGTSLSELRGRFEAIESEATQVTQVLTQYRQRSSPIQRYALLRANGVCEGCGNQAPFWDASGKHFLEVHHLHRLADDGPDSPHNVAAVCPNYNRRAHYNADGKAFNTTLHKKISEIESAQWRVKHAVN